MMWAARRGVAFTNLEVEVQADYDLRGQFGDDAVSPAYHEVRYVITVESDAPEADVIQVLDEADAHSPYHAVFAEPQTLRREVRILPLVS